MAKRLLCFIGHSSSTTGGGGLKERKVMNVAHIKNMKVEAEPIAMVTAYDYPSAKLAEQAGADMLLVGDSLGMVVLGYDSTIPVTIDEMVHHTKAVSRAANKSYVVADLPFMSYYGSVEKTLTNAAKLMQVGQAKAVKMEGGREIAPLVEACVQGGIPVMGHIGLTPQAVNQLGGYKVQGRTVKDAKKLVRDAQALEQAGAFSIVLEMVPEELATHISATVSIPTIGIGAGKGCDGQVLVFHDLLQYASPVSPRFVKHYANVGEKIQEGIHGYVQEVKNRQFPEEKHAYRMDAKVINALTKQEGSTQK